MRSPVTAVAILFVSILITPDISCQQNTSQSMSTTASTSESTPAPCAGDAYFKKFYRSLFNGIACNEDKYSPDANISLTCQEGNSSLSLTLSFETPLNISAGQIICIGCWEEYYFIEVEFLFANESHANLFLTLEADAEENASCSLAASNSSGLVSYRFYTETLYNVSSIKIPIDTSDRLTNASIRRMDLYETKDDTVTMQLEPYVCQSNSNVVQNCCLLNQNCSAYPLPSSFAASSKRFILLIIHLASLQSRSPSSDLPSCGKPSVNFTLTLVTWNGTEVKRENIIRNSLKSKNLTLVVKFGDVPRETDGSPLCLLISDNSEIGGLSCYSIQKIYINYAYENDVLLTPECPTYSVTSQSDGAVTSESSTNNPTSTVLESSTTWKDKPTDSSMRLSRTSEYASATTTGGFTSITTSSQVKGTVTSQLAPTTTSTPTTTPSSLATSASTASSPSCFSSMSTTESTESSSTSTTETTTTHLSSTTSTTSTTTTPYSSVATVTTTTGTTTTPTTTTSPPTSASSHSSSRPTPTTSRTTTTATTTTSTTTTTSPTTLTSISTVFLAETSEPAIATTEVFGSHRFHPKPFYLSNNKEFDLSLKDPTSNTFNTTREKVKKDLTVICNETVPGMFRDIFDIEFIKGSVIVNTTLDFWRELTPTEQQDLNQGIKNKFPSPAPVKPGTLDIVAVVVGSVIGFLFLIVCILCAVLICRRFKKQRRRPSPIPTQPEPETDAAFPLPRPQQFLWQTSVATSSLSRRGQSSVIELSMSGASNDGDDDDSAKRHRVDTVRARNGIKDPALKHFSQNDAMDGIASNWNGSIPRPELDSRFDQRRGRDQASFEGEMGRGVRVDRRETISDDLERRYLERSNAWKNSRKPGILGSVPEQNQLESHHMENQLFPYDPPQFFPNRTPALMVTRSPSPFETSLPRPTTGLGAPVEKPLTPVPGPPAFEGLFVPTTPFARDHQSPEEASARHPIALSGSNLRNGASGNGRAGSTDLDWGQLNGDTSFGNNSLGDVLTHHGASNKTQKAIFSRIQGTLSRSRNPDNIHRTPPSRQQGRTRPQLSAQTGGDNIFC